MIARTRGKRRGTAAVELAVLLPFLMFVFLVTVDFARILYTVITVDNCTHNGAVFGSQTFDNQNQQWLGNYQYWQGPNSQMVSAEKAATEIDGSNLSPAIVDTNVTVVAGLDANGNAINTVTVSYTFNTISQFPMIPSSVAISRSMQARVAPALPNNVGS
jgi:Flp pilus assembly protein TadG